MKFTGLGTLRKVTLDVDKYAADLKKSLTARLIISGKIWLKASVDKIPIPTWSGASRSTFQELAAALGTSVTIGPQISKKNRQSLGRESGRGGLDITGGDTQRYQFFYFTNLRYLAYNEYNRAVKGDPPQPFSNSVRFTPYHFQEIALEAWLKFAKQTKLLTPYSRKYLKVRRP
jgi:hypothetical protein